VREKASIASARIAYQRYLVMFAGEAWDRRAPVGADRQRPLWVSTGTKNPSTRTRCMWRS
jgi:transaldolase